MKKILLLAGCLLSLWCGAQPVFRQTAIACYASGYDEYARVPAPATAARETQSGTITVTYSGFTPAAQAAFDYAKSIWEGILHTTVPIKLNAYFFPAGAGTGLLGITFPNGVRNFPNAPMQDRWYATSLANHLAGTELNAGQADVNLVLNSSMNWYTGTDGNCPVGKYDLVSVALHEMCHGFGFVSLGKVDTTFHGSFGMLQQSDFAPFVTTFPWPALDTLPSAYDGFMVNDSGVYLTDSTHYPNPSMLLQQAFGSGSLYWHGSYGMQYNNNQEPRLYAPAAFSLGSSLSHLDENTYPAGNPNELMTPFASSHSSNHDPGWITIGMLKDIGWNLSYTGLSAPLGGTDISVYPNPCKNYLVLNQLPEGSKTIRLLDLFGKTLLSRSSNQTQETLGLEELPAGMYFISIDAQDGTHCLKMVKGN